ncbi:DUF4236 domain-containing protein [Exiguobacterium flavidum]|uniref:DUF4236 domain-containing protein n=1 Tax=Exiguobacterium flavidum TaxID=2184695 RepID=UPI001300B902|nr:DUF4236 domain-containing protein [Exiguobacterium flavidum]
MGLNFHKSFRLTKNIHLHLSKHGPSLSIGKGRLRHSISRRGISSSVRLFKGLSWRKKW